MTLCCNHQCALRPVCIRGRATPGPFQTYLPFRFGYDSEGRIYCDWFARRPEDCREDFIRPPWHRGRQARLALQVRGGTHERAALKV